MVGGQQHTNCLINLNCESETTSAHLNSASDSATAIWKPPLAKEMRAGEGSVDELSFDQLFHLANPENGG